MKLKAAVVVAGALVLATLLYWVDLSPHPTGIPDPRRRAPRDFSGTAPAGARVELYEDARDGFSATTTAGADGSWQLRWTPTATGRLDRLFVRAVADGLAPLILPARDEPMTIRLQPPVPTRGVVVDARGRPVTAARVRIAQRNGRSVQTIALDAAGAFSTNAFPPGAPLDVLVTGDGIWSRVEPRFLGGGILTVRAHPGFEIELTARDPWGDPVPGARAWLGHPTAFLREPAARADEKGRIVVAGASPGGARLVTVDAPGFLPVKAPCLPREVRPVILWPEREVEVRAFDPRSRTGVDGVHFEVEVRPREGVKAWRGQSLMQLLRPYPARPGRGDGVHVVRLPACPLTLHLSAPGYEDSAYRLDEAADSCAVRLAALQRGPTGRLLLRAANAAGRLPLVVLDESGWHALFDLEEGRGQVEVPARRKLHVASLGAAGGVWMPKLEVEPVAGGENREVRPGLRRALKLTLRVDPPVAGIASAVDVAYERVGVAPRVELEEGRAVFWVRPMREVRVLVEPHANYFRHEGEFTTEQRDIDWKVELRRSAAVRRGLVDRAGNPVAFAMARLWEPGLGGRIRLSGTPRVAFADADGEVLLQGLRSGEAALEIRALGFRTRRFGSLRLVEGEVPARGALTLQPAGRLRGRVVDTDGDGVPGAWVRVLEPQVRRLEMPGGGERDLYDLADDARAGAATGRDGRFEVPDSTPREPLIGIYPTARPDLAPSAHEPGAVLHTTGRAYVELALTGRVQGVYLLLGRTKAVLIKTDPPISLRPLPVVVPAGRVELFIRKRDGTWAARSIDLDPGETVRLRIG